MDCFFTTSRSGKDLIKRIKVLEDHVNFKIEEFFPHAAGVIANSLNDLQEEYQSLWQEALEGQKESWRATKN